MRLQQLALLALEAVLGLGQVAELRLRAAGREQLALVLAEREALPDERGLVGVQDAAVARPDLHADDRVAQQAGGDDVVHLGDRRRVAAQEAVGQPGGLHEPALELDAVARVALGLAHGDPAQGEEPADDDHGDRQDRRDREPQHGRGDAGGSPPWRAGIALHGDLRRGSGARTAT